jgi:hypothetical protein
MKGSIKISTWQDLLNCRDIVQTAPPDERAEVAADILAQIEPQLAAIEERGFMGVPIVETNENRKQITIRDCGEIAEGLAIKSGGKVSGVQTFESPAQDDTEAETFMRVQITKALPDDTALFYFASPVNPYADFGADKEQIDEVKEVLKNYE